MDFSLAQLLGIAFFYLFTLFAAAYVTDRGWLPARFVRHPAIYVFSLGVYASAWAVYGTVGFAYQYGYNFLTYYLGLSGTFLLAPIVLAPFLRLAQTYQLGSLADLLAFRYRSQRAGTMVTLIMIISVLPLLSLQIQAVADTVFLLNKEATPNSFALLFICIIIVFAILFGARHTTAREKHEGLVVAIALESVLKVGAMVAVAGYGLFVVFDGPSSLESWLANQPQAMARMYEPLDEGPWRSLILAFFASAVAMPHMYHMAFTENLNPRALLTAAWGVPLMLFVMALCVPLIMWAAVKVDAPTVPDYFTLGLGIAVQNPILTTIAFIGGLSAASGVLIVTALAVAAMTVNHVILPLYQPKAEKNLYRWLLWIRRVLIFTLLVASYGFYRLLNGAPEMAELGLLSFVGTLQFVPGLIGVVFWPAATRKGFLSGLTVGFLIWLFGMLLPILSSVEALGLEIFDLGFSPSVVNWQVPAMIATVGNVLTFVVVSFFSKASAAERSAAEACTIDSLRRPYRWELSVATVKEIVHRLSTPLGEGTARREVNLALKDLDMTPEENRPYALRRLRDQLETNLSSLLGPSMAQEIIDNSLPYKTHQENVATEDIYFIENRLEEYRDKLTGLAAELDSLRRFHRQTLHDLPIGVCSLGSDAEILSWNRALEHLTNITSEHVVGSNIQNLQQPWRGLLLEFSDGQAQYLQKKVEYRGETRWLSLHKAAIGQPGDAQRGGLVIVIEDLTDTKLLENKLAHSERLASVGRLAAGVAHEIGNPITGIACLAQEIRALQADDDPEMAQIAADILSQTKRVNRIVQSLVSFSHTGHHQQQENDVVSLNECIGEAIHLISLSKDSKEIDFQHVDHPEYLVMGDAQRLQQVFINLLNNARDASPAGSQVCVSASADEETITVHVTDEGSGIPADVQERIFEPFVTTKEPGKGTGLGMALVYSIIEDHYGSIDLTSPLENGRSGTRVTITIPRCYA